MAPMAVRAMLEKSSSVHARAWGVTMTLSSLRIGLARVFYNFGGVLPARAPARADEVPGLVVQQAGDDHEIGLRHQVVEGDFLRPQFSYCF
jgi:hypothetical protein